MTATEPSSNIHSTRLRSSVMNNNNKKLVVLCSNQSSDRQVLKNQQVAFTILHANKIPFATVDGADVANKDERNRLFEISGLHGTYPQFFFEHDSTGDAEYWGDFAHFLVANDNAGGLADAAGSSSPCLLVVLQSMQTCDATVAVRQEQMRELLGNLPYETIDGDDSDCKVTRDHLFTTSGRSDYPQIFQVLNGELHYWGDLQRLQDAGGWVEKLATTTGSEHVAMNTNEAASNKSTSTSEQGETLKTPILPVDSDTAATTKGTASKTKVTTKETSHSDLTVYGATSFVARHVLNYLIQVSISLDRVLHITLAGRNSSKIKALYLAYFSKMASLKTLNAKSKGSCVFDTFVADGDDYDKLESMTSRTKVIINCAGPFAKYSSKVVEACAAKGRDYVDITGEVSWAAEMRERNGKAAAKSGARIISFCGFDSVPSDLAVFAAATELRKKKALSIERATTWHDINGSFNGGTVHTILDMPFSWKSLFHLPPYLMDDPLALVYPAIRDSPNMYQTRDRLAKGEWLNQLLSFDSILMYGVSIPFGMAPVNAKIVHASSIALNYGHEFTYRERHIPAGFLFTTKLKIISLIPALISQAVMLLGLLLLKLPFLGKKLADWILPPGSGMSDESCRSGHAIVYAQVSTALNRTGGRDKANCWMEFQGDPGNYVTAQCVAESALSLLLNKNELPRKSADGFGTPAELLGPVLLQRLQKTSVRPVYVKITSRRNASGLDTHIYK
jgi:short subunit dehydrogenase-like uncharacterized protein